MSEKELKMPEGLKFEAMEPAGYFKCECAVFPVGGDNSLCYTTSIARAELIASTLNAKSTDGLVEAVFLLNRIIDDPPINKDWLDPAVERHAREFLAAHRK